jgi:hypothetical protein
MSVPISVSKITAAGAVFPPLSSAPAGVMQNARKVKTAARIVRIVNP